MEGQMTTAEREFLYNAVHTHLRDKNGAAVLEVGTWKGGGSTFQIANALSHINKGHILYTCETDVGLYNEAVASYRNHPLDKHIFFLNSPSNVLIEQLIGSKIIPQFVFFDGPEDPEINLNDFKRLDEFLEVGAQFCMHDWDLDIRIDGLVSTKAKLLRPYLESLKNWRRLDSLTKPVSVGIVLMEKIQGL